MFQIQVQFTTAFGLTLLFVPIDSGRTLRVEGDGNDGPFVHQGFRLQTINDIFDFGGHALAIIALVASAFGKLPQISLVLGTVPCHVFLGVIVLRALGKEVHFDRARFHRGDILNDASKIAHDKLAAATGRRQVDQALVKFLGCGELSKTEIEVVRRSAFDFACVGTRSHCKVGNEEGAVCR
jgi:hypothetical protein